MGDSLLEVAHQIVFLRLTGEAEIADFVLIFHQQLRQVVVKLRNIMTQFSEPAKINFINIASGPACILTQISEPDQKLLADGRTSDPFYKVI